MRPLEFGVTNLDRLEIYLFPLEAMLTYRKIKRVRELDIFQRSCDQKRFYRYKEKE